MQTTHRLCRACKRDISNSPTTYVMCNKCYPTFVWSSYTPDTVKSVKGGSTFADKVSHSMGNAAESRFVKYCNAMQYRWRSANSYENTHGHFDYVVQLGASTYARVEVKAIKSTERGKEPDYDITYIETKTVGGHMGWVYGCADWIAFEQPHGFLLVKRKHLVTLISDSKNTFPFSKVSGKANTVYRRKDRDDEVFIFQTIDILALPGAFKAKIPA